ncbi:hypothetical protein O0I10_005374 [Lichtheimia ornata]|uniref:Heat shock factor binding protein 1 n=1 Tax=Lichtheimia ornata TaxID=688661 RepID=A0AAD7V4Q6_9FUNG|nr:uncharacterized protein O0I10_005374 [Lichtheimia ornata]KAJ8658992.1 hypothetical protein O0I10_005374 [Lichtheimia ornata]
MASSEDKSTSATMTTDDFAGYIDGVIEKLQSKVETVNNEINDKLEDMSKRIDGLERSLNDALSRIEQNESKDNNSNASDA